MQNYNLQNLLLIMSFIQILFKIRQENSNGLHLTLRKQIYLAIHFHSWQSLDFDLQIVQLFVIAIWIKEFEQLEHLAQRHLLCASLDQVQSGILSPSLIIVNHCRLPHLIELTLMHQNQTFFTPKFNSFYASVEKSPIEFFLN